MAHTTNRSFATSIVASLILVAHSAPTFAFRITPISSAGTASFSDFFDQTGTQTFTYKRPASQSPVMANLYADNASLANAEDADIAIIHSGVTHTEISDTPDHWLNDDGLSDNAFELIRAIANVRVHGLNPQSYQLDKISSSADTLVAHIAGWHSDSHQSVQQNMRQARYQYTPEKHNAQTVGQQLGELLDESFMKLVKDLGQGVTQGRDTQKRFYREPPEVDAQKLLWAVKTSTMSVNQILASVSSNNPGYKRLTQMMQKLLEERAAGVTRIRLDSDEVASADTSGHDATRLRERLIETGDLTPDAERSAYPDAALTAGVKAFQGRHGFEQTGEADEQTRLALNASVDDEIEAVAMSLERYRWLPRELGSRHIVVNITDFRVNLIDDNDATLSMRAVVGRFANQTPSFSENMSYMQFNPTWTVPQTITQKELIPSERKNPGYLAARNFNFLKKEDGRYIRVPASSVTSADLNAEHFPYVLQQRGGAGNALGTMKFMMPNAYAIYLHDTPSQRHFELTERAYSHGCVRLADPQAMAQALMLGDGYSQSQIDQAMRSDKTHSIKFRNHIPTHLVYMTTWVDENQILQTRPDVYDNDAALLSALREADTLISAMDVQRLSTMDVQRLGETGVTAQNAVYQ